MPFGFRAAFSAEPVSWRGMAGDIGEAGGEGVVDCGAIVSG